MIFLLEEYMERYFTKISYNQFKKDVSDDKSLYDKYLLPKRKTQNSAGYDFIAIRDMVIKPGEIVKIPTGYKAKFNSDEVLMLYVRSSMGFKYNVRMCNQVGIIEADYYNNLANEGHIWIALQNEGTIDYVIKAGDGYAQGIFMKFLTCGDSPTEIRKGGIGSTNKEEK
jgi:dUTP pyrophosphatase